ncbi:MAG: SPFH domain-containing protein [Candidatus Micrarchaeia archaeon]|jgi:regulator of protease activity HflC (stomatin/prohibitin superfamily)
MAVLDFCLPAIVVGGIILIPMVVRVIYQYERGVMFQLGKYIGMREPGLVIVIPILQDMRKVDIRILTLDIPKQSVMTKDNVPVSVNGVVYFKVAKPEDALIKIQNYEYAMSQYAQTALRDVVGAMSLDDVLSERTMIGNKIRDTVDEGTKDWGLDVTDIKLQDVEVPDDLKKMMSRQASAEREKRATIIKAEGDKMASQNLADAARTMNSVPGGMQLRVLQTLDGLGPTASNTVVIPLPLDLLDGFKQIAEALKEANTARDSYKKGRKKIE